MVTKTDQEKRFLDLATQAISLVNRGKRTDDEIDWMNNRLQEFKARHISIRDSFLCFGPDDWTRCYGIRVVNPPDFPWSEDVLNSPCPFHKGKTILETHVAFLGIEKLNGEPLSILKFHQLHPATGQPRFYFADNPWYAKEAFATQPLSFRWHLLLREVVPNSGSKTFEDQQRRLPAEYEVPTAVAEVSKNILVFRKSGIYSNSNRYARCQDKTAAGYRVYVGYFDSYGLYVGSSWGDYRSDLIGVGAARKLPLDF